VVSECPITSVATVRPRSIRELSECSAAMQVGSQSPRGHGNERIGLEQRHAGPSAGSKAQAELHTTALQQQGTELPEPTDAAEASSSTALNTAVHEAQQQQRTKASPLRSRLGQLSDALPSFTAHAAGSGSSSSSAPVAAVALGGSGSPPTQGVADRPHSNVSKPQQLLNKLKLGGKKTATSSFRQSSGASLGLPTASSLGAAPSGTFSPTAAAAAAAAGIHSGFSINTRGADSEPECIEELSPHASVPTNPLAPLLTPFRMMKPVASKVRVGAC
jgi:hypothetical protein